jgi:hypothetical protein
MHVELFTISGDHSGIENDREYPTEKLVVDLYPFDAGVEGMIERRLGVTEIEPAKGNVGKLLNTSVDNRDANPLERNMNGKSCSEIAVFRNEVDILSTAE